MQFSITTVVTLLPFVASTLYRKSLENKTISDNIIIVDTIVPPATQPFTWREGELALLVEELREMDIYGGSFTSAVNMDKIFFSGEGTLRGHEYNKRLAQTIISFAIEAQEHGFTVGGAVKQLLKCFKTQINSNLTSNPILLMKSNNVEVRAAVLSLYGGSRSFWSDYYPEIEGDEALQKRILELIDFRSGDDGINLVKNWGFSLATSDRHIKVNWYNRALGWSPAQAFHLYVKYSLQYREMSPEQVIIELQNADNLKELIRQLGEAALLSEESAKFGVELAIVLYEFSLPDLAKDMLSKSNWNLLPEEEKLRICSMYQETRKFLLPSHFELETIHSLDFSNAEIVEKLLRSGNLEEFSRQQNRIFDGNYSQETIMKIGEAAALLVLEVSRKPTKYSWVSNRFHTLLLIIDKTIESCHLSFDTKELNPVMAALDLAFDRGDLLDLVTRYNGHLPMLLSLLVKEKNRGHYIRDIGCRFALKKWIGDKDYYNFRYDYEMRKLLSYNEILDNVDSISNATLWKRMMKHTAQLRNPVA